MTVEVIKWTLNCLRIVYFLFCTIADPFVNYTISHELSFNIIVYETSFLSLNIFFISIDIYKSFLGKDSFVYKMPYNVCNIIDMHLSIFN